MHSVAEKTLHTIKQHRLIHSGDAVFVALSGGADSVCLLHILIALKEHLCYRSLTALHLHHGLRGEDADRDERFVRKVCERWHVELHVKRVDVRTEACSHGETIEEAGRRLRYAFFEERMTGQAHVVLATAHHADDDAETVLMNMFRGCGLQGLSGIPITRGRIVRPLLQCRHEEIQQYCTENNLEYVVDESNFSTEYTRNRLRHTVIPAIETIHPQAVDNILRLSSIAEEENRFLDSLAHDVLLKTVTSNDQLYTTEALLTQPDVIVRRTLRMMSERAGGGALERSHINDLLLTVKNGGSCSLPRRITAHSDGNMLCFVKSGKGENRHSVNITVNDVFEFDSKIYKTELILREEYEIRRNVNKNLFNFCLAYDMIKGDLIMRKRSDGDHFRPFKRHCTKTLKKWFNEQHIPSFLRDTVEVICDEEGVVGLLGLAVDERVAVRTDTKRVLLIKILEKGL